MLPTLLLLLVWYLAETPLIRLLLENQLAATVSEQEIALMVHRIEIAASGLIPIDKNIAPFVDSYRNLRNVASTALLMVLGFFLIGGGSWALWRLRWRINAQRKIEKIIKTSLLLCSIIAILTTVGIVLSLLSESWLFFPKGFAT